MSEKNITIVTGEQAKVELSDSALIHLTNRVNKMEVADSVGFLRHKFGSAIRAVLGDSQPIRAVRRKIDPAFVPIEHMKGLRDIEQIVVAKEGNYSVGMAGFQSRGFDSQTGRPIFEVRRVVVRKGYEGRNIGSQLHRSVIDMILEKDPRALILVEAQHSSMQKICKSFGYQSCDPMRGLEMQYGRDGAKENFEWFQNSGGQFYVYDSLQKKSQH